ncbi:hypothetical protein [Spiroplasma endosymbiont of Othius punctulatus]|uniref:hypothetical protein n=1 Tax=Spiroplasma endosymbiont of Othius punctulatus TaxID=3066289 RepID=UPI0030D517B8
MKKIYAILAIVPSITLSTAIIVDNVFKYENSYNLNYIIDKDKLFDGIDLKMSRMKSYDDGYGNSILSMVQEGIFNNFNFINIDDLEIKIYYGDYEKNNNFEFKFNDTNNAEETVLWFSVEILPSIKSSYSGRVIFNYDFRPKLSLVEKIWISDNYDSINKFSSLTSAINEVFKSNTLINEMNRQLTNNGIENDINYFDKKWFSQTEDKYIEQNGDYSKSDYNNINNSIVFRKELFDLLPKTTRAGFFNLDTDTNFYISKFEKVNSKWFINNGFDYSNFELKSLFNPNTLVWEIKPYLVEFFRSKLIKSMGALGIEIDNKTNIDLKIKQSYSSLMPLEDNDNLSSLSTTGGGKIISAWIEIWLIDDMRVSLDQKSINDGPGFHLDIGEISNE